MPTFEFVKLELNKWKETRDSIQKIAKVMGAVRIAFTEKQKHWYHVNVRPALNGLSTTLIHHKHHIIFELVFDFYEHKLILTDYHNNQKTISIIDSNLSEISKQTVKAINEVCGFTPNIPDELLKDTTQLVYDKQAATIFLKTFLEISIVFKAFKHSLKEETSEVQLWPDHFDLALLWFSGNKVEGVDPNNEEMADEQMNFGFSTGDETIPEPYIYITAYPIPKKMNTIQVKSPVYWNDIGFKGFIIKYHEIIINEDPAQYLYDSFVFIQENCSRQMQMSK